MDNTWATPYSVSLDEAVQAAIGLGWILRARTESYAQLTRNPGKQGCVLVLLLLVGVVPGILYLLWPAKEQILLIETDQDGEAFGRIDGGPRQRFHRDDRGAWRLVPEAPARVPETPELRERRRRSNRIIMIVAIVFLILVLVSLFYSGLSEAASIAW